MFQKTNQSLIHIFMSFSFQRYQEPNLKQDNFDWVSILSKLQLEELVTFFGKFHAEKFFQGTSLTH